MRLCKTMGLVRGGLLLPRRLLGTGRRTVSLASQRFTLSGYATPSSHDQPSPRLAILILHGLFGSKQNWRSIAKNLASGLEVEVHTLDLRNHGESGHSSAFSYADMSADLSQYLDEQGLQDTHVTLIGHSMGGKVAMHHVLEQGDMGPVKRLCIVDSAPYLNSSTGHEGSRTFSDYIRWMLEADGRFHTKKEANAFLAQHIKSEEIRQFLLTNLRHSEGGDRRNGEVGEALTFRINLRALQASLPAIWDFAFRADGSVAWHGPCLFMAGRRADYLTPSMYPSIRTLFPQAIFQEFDTGHWIHAERPHEFTEAFKSFYRSR